MNAADHMVARYDAIALSFERTDTRITSLEQLIGISSTIEENNTSTPLLGQGEAMEVDVTEAELSEGLRLQQELEHISAQSNFQGWLNVQGQIDDLVGQKEKYALREALIEKDFLVTVSEALLRLWPSEEQISDGNTEAFERVSSSYVWFCQEIQQYELKNRKKFANDSAKVIMAILVLPSRQKTSTESAWDSMFQYIDPKVLRESIESVKEMCRNKWEGDVLERKLDALNDEIDKATIGKGSYSWKEFAMDFPMAPVGVVLDISQCSGFINKGDYGSLAILLAANIVRGVADGFLCSDVDMYDIPEFLHFAIGDSEYAGMVFFRVHSVLTFGVSGLMMQIQKAYELRQKNDTIYRMKMFDGMKSSISLLVAGMSLLDNKWSLFEVAKKWATVLYGVISISKSAYTANKASLYDYRHYQNHSTHKSNMVRKSIRGTAGDLASKAFYMSEVLGTFVYLPAEYFQRFSIIIILLVQLAILVTGVFRITKGTTELGTGYERSKLVLFAPSYMWTNPLFGYENDKIAFNNFVVVLRPIPWLVCWVLVLRGLSSSKGELSDYNEFSATVYLSMAAVGIIGYAITATFFYKLGLWLHNEDTSGASGAS